MLSNASQLQRLPNHRRDVNTPKRRSYLMKTKMPSAKVERRGPFAETGPPGDHPDLERRILISRVRILIKMTNHNQMMRKRRKKTTLR